MMKRRRHTEVEEVISEDTGMTSLTVSKVYLLEKYFPLMGFGPLNPFQKHDSHTYFSTYLNNIL